MTYASTDELRARYGTEFEVRTDADLDAALADAARIIDGWLPAGDLSAAALTVLAGHQMILARRALYPDQALDEAHPIVRDARETLDWLKALAAGRVGLPADAAAAADAGTAEVAAEASVIAAGRRGPRGW